MTAKTGVPVGTPPGVAAPAPAALAGVGAAVLALGAGQLAGGLLGPSSAPLVAVGGAAVDRVPPWLKDFATTTFGTHDKQVLLGGAVVVVLALGVVAGLLGRRRPRVGVWLAVALGVVAALAAATRPDASPLAVVPGMIAAVVGAVALPWLLRAAAPGTELDPERRQLVAMSLVAAVGGAALSFLGYAAGARGRGAIKSREAVRLPGPSLPAAPLPAGVEVGVRGVVPFRVPNADFYRIDTALIVPRMTSQEWRLRIHGMVDKEVEIDYQTLVGSGLIQRDLTLICVSNEVGGDLTGNATWLGVPIGPLLRGAGPDSDADMVLSKSIDGFTASTPLDVLLDGRDAIFAVAMNGEPLPFEHGFPVRMIVPGLYGFVSATKWVVDLEVTRFDRAQAYWTPRGWSARAPVKTSSRIDVPRDGARVAAGRVAVAGIAWAQHRGINAVEVSVDGGAWQQARLAAVPSVDTWRQWVWQWDAAPGSHRIAVRAVDGDGVTQTGVQAPPAPDGASGWHTITVDVT